MRGAPRTACSLPACRGRACGPSRLAQRRCRLGAGRAGPRVRGPRRGAGRRAAGEEAQAFPYSVGRAGSQGASRRGASAPCLPLLRPRARPCAARWRGSPTLPAYLTPQNPRDSAGPRDGAGGLHARAGQPGKGRRQAGAAWSEEVDGRHRPGGWPASPAGLVSFGGAAWAGAGCAPVQPASFRAQPRSYTVATCIHRVCVRLRLAGGAHGICPRPGGGRGCRVLHEAVSVGLERRRRWAGSRRGLAWAATASPPLPLWRGRTGLARALPWPPDMHIRREGDLAGVPAPGDARMPGSEGAAGDNRVSRWNDAEDQATLLPGA